MDDSLDADMDERIIQIMPYNSDGGDYDFIVEEYDAPFTKDSPILKRTIPYTTDPHTRHKIFRRASIVSAIKRQSSPEVIRELLIHGAAVNKTTKNEKNTPLNIAATVPKCKIEIIKVLLDHGADVNTSNKFNDTPLIHAIRNFPVNLNLIKLLLESGASINSKNLKGETPLLTALKNPGCTMELFRELLKHKADVNCRDKKGRTPMHYAVKYLQDHMFKIVKELIKQGCDINARDLNGYTPLKWAFQLTRNWRYDVFCKAIMRYTTLKNIQFTYHTKVLNRDLTYISRCEMEVDLMKKHIIDDGISMYNYVMSRTVRTTIGDKLLEILKKEPYQVYNDLIFKKVKGAALLHLLSEHQLYTYVNRKNRIQKITLDGDSTIDICGRLKISDLENLVAAYGWVFKETHESSTSRQLKRPSEEALDIISKYRASRKRKK